MGEDDGYSIHYAAVKRGTPVYASDGKQVWPWLEAGKVKPVIYKVFPAAQAAEAHALMESNQHIGKLVLSWV